MVEFYNIKYGDEPALLGELAQYEMNGPVRKCKFNITMDGSSRFTYLTNEIFVPFVNLVSSSSILHLQLAWTAIWKPFRLRYSHEVKDCKLFHHENEIS